jgi:hypothetical protein
LEVLESQGHGGRHGGQSQGHWSPKVTAVTALPDGMEVLESQGHGGHGTSNDTELEKLKKRLQSVMCCVDCFVS